MQIAFVPSAVPAIADWAQASPDRVWDAITRAQGSAKKAAATGKIDGIELLHIDEAARKSIAVGFDAGMAIVFAAQQGLILEVAERLASRLSRTNWTQHLLCLDTVGLEANEFLSTLTDVVGAIDLTEPITARFAGAMPMPAVDQFIDQIGIHARPWKTSDARGDFKGLMEAASDRPQMVDRPGGEEVYIMSKRVMEAYSHPKSAAELVKAFAHPSMDLTLPIQARPAPRGKVDLPTRSTPMAGAAEG